MRTPFVVIALVALTSPVRAENAGIEFFERKIRPILVEHCYECHSAGAKKIRGQLLLDSRDGVRKGGVNGPVIVPGDPDNSPLIKAVRYTDEATKMPKKGKLPQSLIADLEAWVKMGAPDPRDKAASAPAAKSWEEVVRERRKWWSLQPVKNPSVPAPKNAGWSSDPIDRYLLAKMDAKGLTPAEDANARTLVRRLSLVLTGLAPTVAEVEEFSKAWDTAGAKRGELLEALVDRLLASPHFGERWARHWMDVVRFTETHGNEWNYDVHHAWRYRDYLIRAFNDDVPYDQFVREHLAGDLISPRWNKKDRINEAVLGTAFYRFGEVNHDDCIGLPSIGYDLADNQIDTLSKAFQAMTIACARCHDHKLDAISTRDYHGLLGMLRSSRQVAHTIDAPDVNTETMRKMRDVKAALRVELADTWLRQLDMARLVEAVKNEKLAFENPLGLWRKVAANVVDAEEKGSVALAWKTVSDEYVKELNERTKLNQQFTTLADFRKGAWPDWQVGGQGLRGKPSPSGDFTVGAGDNAVAAILPAGAFTHSLSEKLNGVLRSPLLGKGKKFISFQILGDRAAAVRLVANNCQLNYRNFKYLTRNEIHWITFSIPDETDALRVYAEVMTKFDNPKFPDQLGSLGSGKDYRVPWDKAAADPRSHFGVTHVVLHDQPAPPRTSLEHLRGVLDAPSPQNGKELAQIFFVRAQDSLHAWKKDIATDEDVAWLDTLLNAGALPNRANLTPTLAKLVAEYRKLEGELALPRVAPGLADFGPGFEQPIFARGDCTKPGERAPRQYVGILLSPPGKGAGGEGSGRRELANNIASKDNPLTARVFVNRVWHHLFGTGIVRTVDDFGHVGELPTHPELLDYLADRFVREGWSIKKIIRAIVLTRTFRLSHTPTAAMLEADPENRLLARYPARRMEAEAIRDSLLATSGRLDRTLFGPSISAFREKEYADRRLFKGPLDGDGRRSIYLRVTLMEAPKFLEVFNFPGGKVCQGRRDVTNTPAQALAMLNDPFVHDQADVWAKRLLERKNDSVEARVDAMFREALGRNARKVELERFMQFVDQAATSQKVNRIEVLNNPAVWRAAAHAVFNLQEFITIP